MSDTTITPAGERIASIEEQIHALKQARKAEIEAERAARETDEFAKILDYWAEVLDTFPEDSVEYSQALRAKASIQDAIAGRPSANETTVIAAPAILSVEARLGEFPDDGNVVVTPVTPDEVI